MTEPPEMSMSREQGPYRSFVRCARMAIHLCLWLSVMGGVGCAPRTEQPEAKTIDDLERALDAIEDRRDAELRIIEEQNREIEILEQNLVRVKSEGMRDKIRGELEMKRSAIWKAEKNLANQDTLLRQLYEKRDSLLNREAQ